MKKHLALTSTQKYLIGLGVLALLGMACAMPPSQPLDPWRPAQLGGGSPLATPQMLPIETATTQVVVDADAPAIAEVITATAEPTTVPVQIATIVSGTTVVQPTLDPILATATPFAALAISETMPISGSKWVTLTVNGFLSATQHFTDSKLVVTGVITENMIRFTTVRFDSAASPTNTNVMTTEVVGAGFYKTVSGTFDIPLFISTTITGTQICQEAKGLMFLATIPMSVAPLAFIFDKPMTFTAQFIDQASVAGIPTNHYQFAPISYTIVVSDNFANLGMNFGDVARTRPIVVSSPGGEIWVSDTGDLVRIEVTNVRTCEHSERVQFETEWKKIAAGLNDNGAEWVQLPEICKNPIQDNTIFAL